MILVTCNKCARVSMGVSKSYAESAVSKFNKYYNALSQKKQDDYYGGKKSSLNNYKCLGCGGESFRPAVDGDWPTVSNCDEDSE